jgi:hypothetical protein
MFFQDDASFGAFIFQPGNFLMGRREVIVLSDELGQIIRCFAEALQGPTIVSKKTERGFAMHGIKPYI